MKTLHCRQLALAVAAFGFMFAGGAAAGVYYVDTNNSAASDSNPGSESSPWKTIQKAASTLKAGDTVYVKAGTYRELYTGSPSSSVAGIKPQSSGTASAPITFKAYPGHKVVINQSKQGAGFYIEGKSYITIDGFEIADTKTGGVYTKSNPSGIVVRNSYIHHVYGDAGVNAGAVKFDDCGYCTVEGNRLHDVYVGGTISNQNTAGVHSYDMHHTTVANNEIYRVHSGVFHKRSAGLKGTIVRNNFIHDTNNGVWYSVGGSGDPAHVDQEVYENVFVNTSQAVYGKVDETSTASHGLEVHNNVVSGGQGVVIKGYQGVKIWDNVFLDADPAIMTIASSRRASRIDFADYNLYWTGTSILLDQYGTDTRYTSLSAWQAAVHPHLATEPGTHSLVADPSFVDADGSDFHLTAVSAARDAGRYGDDIGAYPAAVAGNPPAAPMLIDVE